MTDGGVRAGPVVWLCDLPLNAISPTTSTATGSSAHRWPMRVLLSRLRWPTSSGPCSDLAAPGWPWTPLPAYPP